MFIADKSKLLDRVENDFTYHAPNEDQIARMHVIREQSKTLAFLIVEHCPIGREQGTALTLLEQVSMQANAAIAREQKNG